MSDRADRREEKRRDAIASTAHDLRRQAERAGRSMSQADAEKRVRNAVIREERRNP